MNPMARVAIPMQDRSSVLLDEKAVPRRDGAVSSQRAGVSTKAMQSNDFKSTRRQSKRVPLSNYQPVNSNSSRVSPSFSDLRTSSSGKPSLSVSFGSDPVEQSVSRKRGRQDEEVALSAPAKRQLVDNGALQPNAAVSPSLSFAGIDSSFWVSGSAESSDDQSSEESEVPVETKKMITPDENSKDDYVVEWHYDLSDDSHREYINDRMENLRVRHYLHEKGCNVPEIKGVSRFKQHDSHVIRVNKENVGESMEIDKEPNLINRARMFLSIVKTLQQIHHAGCYHGDTDNSNFIITKSNNEGYHAVAVDLEFSREEDGLYESDGFSCRHDIRQLGNEIESLFTNSHYEAPEGVAADMVLYSKIMSDKAGYPELSINDVVIQIEAIIQRYEPSSSSQ